MGSSTGRESVMPQIPPLSERMRPTKFSEIVGQEELLGPGGFIASTIKKKKPLSILLWGPPGSGKTSIARLYAKAFSLRFEHLSAIFSGVADLKKLLVDASDQEPILLFVDEIHRFNKAQQDAFLPFLESGKLVLVGATIENPSFYINPTLLSRLRILRLAILDDSALEKILKRYEKSYGRLKSLTPTTRRYLIQLSHGDGRYLLNLVENLEQVDHPMEVEELQRFLQEKAPLFDKGYDQHYNLISALHKSLRGSDPDAALYWFARMIHAGEDPLYIARRLIRMASEDIGEADPQALVVAIASRDAYEMLGSPEGELALAQAVVYLALSPKSNALYTAFGAALEAAHQTSHLAPPLYILNAPTAMMKRMGYGKGYIYDHDTPQGFSGQDYFPPEMKRRSFYHPRERGFEREMKKRLDYFDKLRQSK